MLTHLSRYVSVQVGMDFRYNEFLLQRATVRKLQISSQKLLNVARELLTLTLTIIEQAPKIGRDWCDLPWIVRMMHHPFFWQSANHIKDRQIRPFTGRCARARASAADAGYARIKSGVIYFTATLGGGSEPEQHRGADQGGGPTG
jgi:hypothetical protein